MQAAGHRSDWKADPATVAWSLAGLLMAGLTYWWGVAATPEGDWNSIRLYPSFLLAAGISPYNLPGVGPVTGWIYGPVMPFLHLPATLAPSLTSVMMTSALINLVALLAPLAVIVHAAARESGADAAGKYTRQLLLLSLVPLLPALRGYMTSITCDPPAIGLTLLSCWRLAAAGPAGRKRDLAAAALLAVLAVWTKQTLVGVILGQLLYLVLFERPRARLLPYLAWLALTGAAVTAALVGTFGWDRLFINLWLVPAGHPLKSGSALWGIGIDLARQVLPMAGLLAFYAWKVRTGKMAAPSPVIGRHLGMLVTVGVVLLPFGLLGGAKLGGAGNSFHAVAFFFCAVLVALVATWPRGARPELRLVGLATVGAGMGALILGAECGFRLAPSPRLELQAAVARARPQEVYFPYNPLVTWWTEKTAYHAEYGLMDQAMAGYGSSRSHYLAHLPPRMRIVIYPPNPAGELAPQIFSDLQRRLEEPGDERIYVRPGTALENPK